MSRDAALSEFDGFADPKTNYTRLPNEFFDRLLPALEPAQISALLFVFRRTWGWQKLFDQISESQFTNGTGLSKNTVRKALNSLETEDPRCIIRYAVGVGRNRKTYFFIHSSKTRQIVKALKSGQITIKQAELFNSLTADIGSEIDPNNGSKTDPIFPASGQHNGSRIDPTKESRTKKKNIKKTTAPANTRPSPFKSKTADTAERISEQRLFQKRRREGSTGQIMRLGDILPNLEIPLQESPSS